MYAEIAADNVESKKSLLTEGKIYTFKRFRVLKSKSTYRPVESEFMIDITCHTLIEEKHDAPSDFSLYTYSLTQFADLPMLVGETKRFIGLSLQLFSASKYIRPNICHRMELQRYILTSFLFFVRCNWDDHRNF